MSVLVVVWVTGCIIVRVLVVVDTSTLVTVGRREEKQVPFHGSVKGDGARKAIYSQYMHRQHGRHISRIHIYTHT